MELWLICIHSLRRCNSLQVNNLGTHAWRCQLCDWNLDLYCMGIGEYVSDVYTSCVALSSSLAHLQQPPFSSLWSFVLISLPLCQLNHLTPFFIMLEKLNSFFVGTFSNLLSDDIHPPFICIPENKEKRLNCQTSYQFNRGLCEVEQ